MNEPKMVEDKKPIATVHNMHYEPMTPDGVYIGRAGHGQDGYFGNPYSEGTREQNVERYREYLRTKMVQDEEFRRRILDLKGKRLFCFCTPRACHGDVIVDALTLFDSYGGFDGR